METLGLFWRVGNYFWAKVYPKTVNVAITELTFGFIAPPYCECAPSVHQHLHFLPQWVRPAPKRLMIVVLTNFKKHACSPEGLNPNKKQQCDPRTSLFPHSFNDKFRFQNSHSFWCQSWHFVHCSPEGLNPNKKQQCDPRTSLFPHSFNDKFRFQNSHSFWCQSWHFVSLMYILNFRLSKFFLQKSLYLCLAWSKSKKKWKS